ncbi:MAG: hypothetical protein PHS99_00595 [Candidatus Marinimicrobia bacterium]|nr:hypothetical protein [Candidatus Neomarinimicrobiota bacterium]
MNKRIIFLITVLLFLWVAILLHRNKELLRVNLHAERSMGDIIQSQQLWEMYGYTPIDSAFSSLIHFRKGLLLLVNSDEQLPYFCAYLKECFPLSPLTVIANKKRILSENEWYTSKRNFPQDFDVSQNILCYYSTDTIRYLFVYEPANPWLLESNLKILRKFYENDY